jgi:putative endonuclease
MPEAQQEENSSGDRVPKPASSRGALGRKGEGLAAQHLESIGYRILERNWRSKHTRNEIDLIALDGETVVFVEVKTARTTTYGDPLSWITPRKRAAIIMAARAFLAGWHKTGTSFRFDAITVGPPGREGRLAIRHVPSAFTADDP